MHLHEVRYVRKHDGVFVNYIPNDRHNDKAKGRSYERPFIDLNSQTQIVHSSRAEKGSKGIRFWVKYPFVIAAFKWREHKQWRQIIPRRWRSPASIIEEDLGMYARDSSDRFDLKFIDDFAKARDELLSQIKKQIILSGLVFLFLLSNYLALGLSLNIGGFSIRYSPGIPEGLLLLSNLLSCYTLILQANSCVLDATIRSAIKFGVPEELRAVYLARYFPHEQFGRYQPFNMPYLVPTRLQIFISKWVAILFLVVLVLSFLAFASCNLVLLVHYLWIKPNFGIWSHLLLGYILLCGLVAFFYSILTRLRLPYLDYTVNNEIELLKQIDPEKYQGRLQEVYGKLNRDRAELEQSGYLRSEHRE